MRAILTYHSIDDSGSAISCSREAFLRHVAWFSSAQVPVVSIPELLEMPDSADGLSITFDDGFQNFGDFAAPRLLALGVPVTVFAVTDRVGHSNAWSGTSDIPRLPLLTWEQLAALHGAGVQIGSHTRTHPDLTRLSPAAMRDEIHGSADVIEANIGAHPSVFAYPYGSVDGTIATIVADSYQHACTTEFKSIDDSVQTARLPRLDAYYFGQPGMLESWGTTTFDRFLARRHQLRQIRRAPVAMARRWRELTR